MKHEIETAGKFQRSQPTVLVRLRQYGYQGTPHEILEQLEKDLEAMREEMKDLCY